MTTRKKRDENLEAKSDNFRTTNTPTNLISDDSSDKVEYNQELIDRQIEDTEKQHTIESLASEISIEQRVGNIEAVLKEIVESVSEDETQIEIQEIPLEDNYIFVQLLASFLTMQKDAFVNKMQNKQSTDDLIDWGISQALRVRKKLKEIET